MLTIETLEVLTINVDPPALREDTTLPKNK
jgi:hypothetical protein